MWKIYCLFSKYDNQIRYVGMTKRSLKKRLSEHLYYKNRCLTEWIFEQNKNIDIMLLENNIYSLEECNMKEIFWIDFYKKEGNLLLNKTKGGDGTNGHLHSDDTKKLISKSKKGKNHSKETKEFMSISRMGDMNNMYGVKHTVESKLKISKNKIGKSLNLKPESKLKNKLMFSKKVLMYDNDFNFIKEYESLKSVINDGFCRISVSKCCRGIYKLSGGYIWKFTNG